MAADIAGQLEEVGIHLRRFQPGEHRCACPKCSRKRDDVLAVRIDDKGATWFCHRASCGWTGAVSVRDRPEMPRRRDAAFDAAMERLRARDLAPKLEQKPIDPRPLRVWAESQSIWRTPAETYLRRRNLIPTVADALAPYPWEHLRFHPSCQMDGGRFPALIVAINEQAGRLVGVQRIALTADGLKAAIPKPKMALGPIKGNAARLADWRTTDTLALTEGVEDALAYMILTGTPTWAACGGGMIKSMVLPKAIANVVIVADADEAGMRAAREAYAEFKSQGRNVRVVRPIGAKDPAEIVGRVA